MPDIKIPENVEQVLDAKITETVEKALASRPVGQPTPSITNAIDHAFDVDKKDRAAVALGLRVKSKLLERAEMFGHAKREEFVKLKEFMGRTKATGVFESVFDQGGSVWARETQSAEVIEVLRNASILLQAGARVESGYGSKLTIGKMDTGATVYWTAEGVAGTKSNPTTSNVSLGGYKATGLVPVSNSLLRKGSMNSAAQLGQDLAAALALAVDQAGLLGPGVTRPLGVYSQTASANKEAISDTTVAAMIADMRELITQVAAANIPLAGNNPFYFMRLATMMHLANQRDSAGWVFPGLQNIQAPTLNGFPVYTTETLDGEQKIGFGLAKQLLFGEATPLEITVGEDGTDFSADMQTVRGVTEVDWALRHSKAFAWKHTVTY